MDYEKKYNEAMLRADEAVQKGCLDKEMFDIIFPPEESEDERIRTEIRTIIQNGMICHYGIIPKDKGKEYLSWLEKQKEQQPVESSTNLDEILDDYFANFKVPEHQIIFEDTYRKIAKDFYEMGRKSKPVEWSEDDKKILDDVSHILIGLNYKQIAKDYKQAVEKLIYARPSWKPSEIHKTALLMVIRDPNNAGSESCQLALRDLLEQLKKL